MALAARTLECMLADVDANIVQLMCQRGAELAIIGRDQVSQGLLRDDWLLWQRQGVPELKPRCRRAAGACMCPASSVLDPVLFGAGLACAPLFWD